VKLISSKQTTTTIFLLISYERTVFPLTASSNDHMKRGLLIITAVGLSLISTDLVIINALTNEKRSVNSEFKWAGKWVLNAESDRISFYVNLNKMEDGIYSGHHCMVDNDAWGGSLDCAEKSPDGRAKPYQVKQLLEAIDQHDL
jgi:hypothetical protein